MYLHLVTIQKIKMELKYQCCCCNSFLFFIIIVICLLLRCCDVLTYDAMPNKELMISVCLENEVREETMKMD